MLIMIIINQIISFWGFTDNEISSICKLDQMKNLNTLGMVSHFHVHF